MFDMQTGDNMEIKGIVDAILSAVPAVAIYLFGSFANGTAADDSDYDFYVVVPDGVQPLESTWKIKRTLRKSVNRTRNVDMFVGTESKFNEYKNTISFIEGEVARTGVVLYG